MEPVDSPGGLVESVSIGDPVRVVHIEPAVDGWFVQWSQAGRQTGYVHLTSEWCDDMHQHQIKPNKVHNPAFNRLRYMLQHGQGTAEEISGVFSEAYGQIIKTRQDRSNLGLKAVTRDGDDDLKAVQQGESVRPWNSANPKSELHDWIKEQRANR